MCHMCAEWCASRTCVRCRSTLRVQGSTVGARFACKAHTHLIRIRRFCQSFPTGLQAYLLKKPSDFDQGLRASEKDSERKRYDRNIVRDERSALVPKNNHGVIRGVNHSQLTLPFKTCIRNQPVATWVARSKTRHRSCCTCTYSANDRLTHSQITAWQICTHLSM